MEDQAPVLPLSHAPVSPALYADGGCILQNPSPWGGPWAWRRLDEFGEVAQEASGILIPSDYGTTAITNNMSELYALIDGLENLPICWTGTVFSDSYVSLMRVFKRGGLNNVPQEIVRRLRDVGRRLDYYARISWVLLDGHPTRAQLAAGIGKRGHRVSKHNVWCDQECGRIGTEFMRSNHPRPGHRPILDQENTNV